MTPALIKVAAEDAGLTHVSLPTCSVAGKTLPPPVERSSR